MWQLTYHPHFHFLLEMKNGILLSIYLVIYDVSDPNPAPRFLIENLPDADSCIILLITLMNLTLIC